jgi:hypothetical protein
MVLLCPGFAHAHETWADGKKVPDWVKQSCCGSADVHRLTVSNIHTAPWNDNYMIIDGYREPIRKATALPSEDDMCGYSIKTMSTRQAVNRPFIVSLCQWASKPKSTPTRQPRQAGDSIQYDYVFIVLQGAETRALSFGWRLIPVWIFLESLVRNEPCQRVALALGDLSLPARLPVS